MTTHSPADILRQYLVTLGVVTMPTTGTPWPAYVENLPESETSEKDQVLCLYDTFGRPEMPDMQRNDYDHPGIQIMLRSRDHRAGWVKLKELCDALDAIRRDEVTIGSSSYRIDCVLRKGNPTPLGEEKSAATGTQRVTRPSKEEERRRDERVINCICTITEL